MHKHTVTDFFQPQTTKDVITFNHFGPNFKCCYWCEKCETPFTWNELCHNSIKTVTWECRPQCSYLGENFLAGSCYSGLSEGDGALVMPERQGSLLEPGSHSEQQELCGPAKEPRIPLGHSSSTGQWEWMDPDSDNPFWCCACKVAMMYSTSPFQSLKFYECKAWRREALNWLKSQLLYHYNHKIIHGLVQAV